MSSQTTNAKIFAGPALRLPQGPVSAASGALVLQQQESP